MVIVMLGALAAACSSDRDVQWMKPGPYTSAEFNQDRSTCTRDGDLDEACMEARGWIAVQADKTPPEKKTPTYRIPRPQ